MCDIGGDTIPVSISKGNSKMGSIPSVSLPAILTCRPCACASVCYAHKLERIRPNVAQAYQNNLQILLEDPSAYWREVEAAVMMTRYFRFHVSGDIPNEAYFNQMVAIARRQLHCNILCFTKQYHIVNTYIEKHGELPVNMHIIFSAWRGLPMDNPYMLPEAHVRYRDGTTTAPPGAKECGGNCTECAKTDCGCWTLSSKESIVFQEH